MDGAPSDANATDLTIAGRFLHGVPGADWRFRRPFDHFDASLALVLNEDALGDKAFGSLLVRGLVVGRAYGEGTSSGLWGLFAAYDYISPEVFRASSSNVSLGTVGQVDLGRSFALQGTTYAGVGFGAAGVSEQVVDERDYHFGLQAVGLAELSLAWAKRIRLPAPFASTSSATSGRPIRTATRTSSTALQSSSSEQPGRTLSPSGTRVRGGKPDTRTSPTST